MNLILTNKKIRQYQKKIKNVEYKIKERKSKRTKVKNNESNRNSRIEQGCSSL